MEIVSMQTALILRMVAETTSEDVLSLFSHLGYDGELLPPPPVKEK